MDPDVWRAHLDQLARHEPFADFTYRVQGPAGPIWVRTSGRPVFADDGAFLGYRGAGVDVSTEVDARRAAEAARGLLQAALETTEETYAIWDADDRLVACNDQFRAYCGLSAEQLCPGVTYEATLRACLAQGRFPGAQGREEAWLEQRLERHRDPGPPFELQLADDRWLLVREQRTAGGEIIVASTDVTTLKRQQSQLREALAAAEEANAHRAAFMAQMSHELRTPMNAILGFAEVIESQLHGPVGDRRYVEYVEHIRDSGQQLLDLINDLLNIARIDAGSFKLCEETLELSMIIAESIELMAPIAERKRVTLAPAPAGKVCLRADRRALRQVLLNLLSNAVKFSSAGDRVAIEAVRDDDGLAIVVADTGRGIPHELLEVVWRPFEPVEDRLLSRPLLGAGLGLSVVRTLMELHQGTATLDSEVGVGTRVTARFPAARLVQRG